MTSNFEMGVLMCVDKIENLNYIATSLMAETLCIPIVFMSKEKLVKKGMWQPGMDDTLDGLIFSIKYTTQFLC